MSPERLIYHIADIQFWQNGKKAGAYRPPTFAQEGFIHCSTENQFIRVANFLFKGRSDLVLLEIDTSEVEAEIIYEGEAEEKFPHIYGPLNLDAVLRVLTFKPSPDGTFQSPL